MARWWPWLHVGLIALGFCALGGCPIASDPTPDSYRFGAGLDSPADSRPAPDLFDPVRPVSTTDTLAAEFPDCDLPADAADLRSEILRLVNVERAAAGAPPVTYNATLEGQAERYACEMIQYEFFDHVDPVTGSTLRERAAESGYDYWVLGENLAAGQPTPARAMSDWMNSPSHRANILDARFTEVGVGVRSGGPYGIYWVQEFGRPYSAGP